MFHIFHDYEETSENVSLCLYDVTYTCKVPDCTKVKVKRKRLHDFMDSPWENTGLFDKGTGQRRYIRKCKRCNLPCDSRMS